MTKTKKRTALITGITGQDGAYLAEFLLGKGYAVHGLMRWDAPFDDAQFTRLKTLGIADKITVHNGDLTDTASVMNIIKTTQADEIYNLGALSHVGVSFDTPASAFDINTKGTLAILEAVRVLGLKDVRVYQASSSEMFGNAHDVTQNEQTPMIPVSPYGVSKLAAYHMARIYRDSYGMFVANGILFNHESPLRGGDFVTQKIVRGARNIKDGDDTPIILGNLNARRDWGHARDCVRGMWMMLQADSADDFVLASGETRSVRTFVEAAFKHIGTMIKWIGEGVNEIGSCTETGKTMVRVSSEFFRPNELHVLCGDAAKARDVLGWSPEILFDELVADMMSI